VNSPITVGLVGFGMAARVFHAPLIHANPHLRLAQIVQRHGDEAANTYSQAKVVRDLDAMLADAAVELVVVATPNTTHFEFASRALKAGKHIVVDKPLTITTRDADELIELSNKAGRLLSVFQNRRWDGDFLTVQEILSNNRLGRLAQFESRYDRFRPTVNPQKWREQSRA
jgi:predicted dehydrogenase